MRCKNCGDVQPDPDPIVKIVEKKVEVGDGVVAVRLAMCATAVFLLLIGSCAFMGHRKYSSLEKAFSDPTIKFEHKELPNGGTELKISR